MHASPSSSVRKFTAAVSKSIVETKTLARQPSYRLHAMKILLYADRGLVVLNKPNGLISQLSNSAEEHVESNIDVELFSSVLKDLRERLLIDDPLRTIHRLDKATTGALALACTRQSAKELSQQLSTRVCHKTYLALVCGDVSSLAKPTGSIKTELVCENGWVRIPGVTGVYERGLAKPGREESPRVSEQYWTKTAISEYEVLATSPDLPLSLMRLNLLTGYKRQLRVHLAQHLRMPILGDSWYADPQSSVLKNIKHRIPLPPGLFLHSSRISFHRYSPSRFRLTVGAPLPNEFVQICNAAKIPLDLDDEMGGVWVDETKVRGWGGRHDTHQGGSVEDAVKQIGGKWYGPSSSTRPVSRSSQG